MRFVLKNGETNLYNCFHYFCLDPPKITAPGSIQVLTGTSLKLLCTVRSQAPVTVYWTRDRTTLESVIRQTGVVNVTHVIPSARSEHQGKYACIASNDGGTASAVTMVNVKGTCIQMCLGISNFSTGGQTWENVFRITAHLLSETMGGAGAPRKICVVVKLRLKFWKGAFIKA